MITIIVLADKHGIFEINVQGHANSADHGKDLVCAAITAISTGASNAFSEMDKQNVKITIQDGFCAIKILKQDSYLSKLMSFYFYQLKTIADQYKKYIKLIQKNYHEI